MNQKQEGFSDMDKRLIYGLGIGAAAVALYLYLRKKKPAAPVMASKPVSAPVTKKPPITSAPAPATTEPIFVDDKHLPSFADTLVTPSTTPPVPLNRDLFEIPFSPKDILPKGIEYAY